MLVVGSVYQYLAERRDLRLNPPAGDLVDIGGYRLHLHCVGSGGPIVVIEAGLNSTHRVVAGATHFIQWNEPGVIVETIEELVRAYRLKARR